MDELQRFTRYGEKKAGTNNKFYEVEAQENEDGRATWIFRWGRIGTTGQSKEGETYSFSGAKSICLEQFRIKTEKGYREVNAMEALASAVEEVHERKTNGLSAVEIVIPCFHAGKSEKRCQEFCQKWLDKLNIVRGSRWDLDANAYEKQIEGVLKGYTKEWRRIRTSKTHGPNLGFSADAAARIFFDALKRDTAICTFVYFEGSYR